MHFSDVISGQLHPHTFVPLDLRLGRRCGQRIAVIDPRGDRLLQGAERVLPYLRLVLAERCEFGERLAGRKQRAIGVQFDVDEVDHFRPKILQNLLYQPLPEFLAATVHRDLRSSGRPAAR